MLAKIPPYIREITEKFNKNNFKIYLVGGCVRDLLLNKKVKDWDLTTNATPSEMLKLYPNAFYNNDYGTVGIPLGYSETEHPEVVEITTFRTETNYSDKRRPDNIAWGKTVNEDLERRDFTINAIAATLEAGKSKNEIEIIDPFGGQDDLNNKLVRAVGNADERFNEDALRLMRAIRFASQLGFSIEEQTLDALTKNAKHLTHIAKERVRDELLKTIASDFPYEGVLLLTNTGLLEYIIPELLEGMGVSQARPGRHHTEDVFTHNLLSLKFCPSADPIVRFAALIHDIGKPRVKSKDEHGLVIFYNHEVMGSRLAYEICERLRFSKKDRHKVVNLIRWHMFTVDENITDAAVRRFIRRIGVENIKDMIDLRIGDRLGGGTQTAESWRLKLFKKRLEEQLAPLPFSINDLAIDGNDVMEVLNIPPSKRVGEILQMLFEEIDEDLSKNTKDYLLERLKKMT